MITRGSRVAGSAGYIILPIMPALADLHILLFYYQSKKIVL